MRRIVVTAVFTMLTLGLCSTLDAAPLLAVDQLDFDFGFAPQNSKVCRIFQLRNDGDDTLIVTKVIPGCGCTQMPLKDTSLAPGETTQLEIVFSTGHYSGPVTKRPRIETNETTSTKYMSIQTNVVQRPDSTYPLQIRPYKLDMSQFGEKVRDKMPFTIANVSDVKHGLILVSYPTELMTVDMPSDVAAGASAEGLVTLTPAATEKAFETSITFQLNDDAKTRFTIPIKRSLKSPTQASTAVNSAGTKP
jgi:hypothetical protein